MKKAAILAGLLLLLLVAMSFRSGLVAAPELSAAEPGGFDTARAFQRLERVLGDQRPHPVDSDASDGVRSRLVAELRAIGLEPQVTDGIACNGSPTDRSVSCARIRNVVATVGPTTGRHVLFVSHYDSVPLGPGASDDGIGVAAMLETAAALKDKPLRRPVTFLFDEGEEAGLIGARAFLERNPVAARVDTLVNLESRGVEGPAIMFETSRPNGGPIAHFDRAVNRPVANSLTTGFYRLVPNSTDVAVFDDRDWTILNFAVIGNETRYHSPGDTLAALDPRSLGHMGRQALALAESFAAAEPVEAQGSERLYADLLGRTLVTLPLWLGTALLWALLAGFAFLAWRRRGGLGVGAGAIVLALADAALTVFVLQTLIGWLRPGEFWRAHPELIAFAVDATALASSLLALAWLAARVPAERLRLAFWLVFLLLGAVLSLLAPGAAIFFLLPPAVAAASFLVPRGRRLLALVAWALLFLSWAPLLQLSQVLLDFDAGWTFAPVAALILIPVLIEMKPLLAQLRSGRGLAAVAAGALLAWLPTATAPAYSIERKQRLTLEYVWDAEARKGRWLVYHEGGPLPERIEAAGPFERGVEVPWSSYKRWAAPAEGPAVAPPSIELLAERKTEQGRLVSFRLEPSGADVVRLRVPPEAQLKAVEIGGRVTRFGAGKKDEDYQLRCHGRACEGLEVRLLVGSAEPVEATIVGMRTGLPASARPLLEARPATAQPRYSPDATYAVGKTRL